MSEMVERVAKAWVDECARRWPEGVAPWDEVAPDEREAGLLAARAAIEAMREPTEEMKAAARGPYSDPKNDDEGDEWYPFSMNDLFDYYTKMIDGALAQPVEPRGE